MRKIPTLFKKDPNNLGRVINEIDPINDWVLSGNYISTRKWDGSACAIIRGELYKRYDAKKGKKAPEGAIPCQEPDNVTGHHPHWIKCDENKSEDKYFIEAFHNLQHKVNGTYELCGQKVQGNPEFINGHKLIMHGDELIHLENTDFEYLRIFLSDPMNDIEGIVFYHTCDDRMCKIRKSDFGIKR